MIDREYHLQQARQWEALGNWKAAASEYAKAEDYRRAAAVYKKVLASLLSYELVGASVVFGKAGDQQTGLNCLARAYPEPAHLDGDELSDLCKAGLLDPFLERVIQYPGWLEVLRTSIWSWRHSGSERFDEWYRSGSCDRFTALVIAGKDRLPGDRAAVAEWLRFAGESAEAAGQYRTAGDRYVEAARLCPRNSWNNISSREPPWERAACCYADCAEYGLAAEAAEQSTGCTDHMPAHVETRRLLMAAKIFERAGKAERAGALYVRVGRPAKAQRVTGTRNYDLKEVESMLPDWRPRGSIRPFEDSRAIMEGQFDFRASERASAAHAAGKVDEAVAAWRLHARSGVFAIWEHWLWVPELYARVGDRAKEREARHEIEHHYRRRGDWFQSAIIWFWIYRDYDEFERVCVEEDELEIAALWYERAHMPERAARVYALMAGVDSSASDPKHFRPSEDASVPKCTVCGEPMEEGFLVCPVCETPLGQPHCSACGRELKAHWKRCPCGAAWKR